MMSTGSIGATRKSATHTNLTTMQTGKVFLPSSWICLPSVWYTVPSYICSGTGYCSAVSLDMMFTPKLVSTAALLSAPPISALTSIDGPPLSPTDVAFEDPGRFRTKTVDTFLAGALLGGLISRPGRSSFKLYFLFGQFLEICHFSCRA